MLFSFATDVMTKVTKQYLKDKTKEFDVGCIYQLDLSSLGMLYTKPKNSKKGCGTDGVQAHDEWRNVFFSVSYLVFVK